MTVSEAIEVIYSDASGIPEYGLQWEVTWMFVHYLRLGYSPAEALWHGRGEWDV